jgi:hypothetical protein
MILKKSLYSHKKGYAIYSAVHQWCEFKSSRGKNTNVSAQKSNSNTAWFNFQTDVIFSSNLVSQITLRSSGKNIVYGTVTGNKVDDTNI